MGSFFSSVLANVPLVGPVTPAVAINACFVYPEHTTFRFKTLLWEALPQDRVVTEALTGRVFFRFDGPTVQRGVLQDANYAPIVYYSAVNRQVKIAADPNGEQAILTVTVRFTLRPSKMLQIRFRNLSTGKDCDLGMDIDLPSRKMIIWMDELATHGKRMKMPIAHIRERVDARRDVPESQQENEITIAPNVDTAMVMAVALGMLDRSGRHDDD